MKELEVFVKKPGLQGLGEAEARQCDCRLLPAIAWSDISYRWQGQHALECRSGHGRHNEPSVAVVQFEKPLDMPEGTQMKVVWRMGEMLGCCRFSITTSPHRKALPIDYAAILALQVPAEKRTPEQQQAIFIAWRLSSRTESDQ